MNGDDAVRAARGADLVIFVGGLSPRIEGEEMRVDAEGFFGGDRTAIDLPKPQEALLERVVGAGKPTVLVLMNGSAVAVNWADKNVPAIIDAWYPGVDGGAAIAAAIAGDDQSGRSPAGHILPLARRPARFQGLRHGRPHLSLPQGRGALSLRPWPQLHALRLFSRCG